MSYVDGYLLAVPEANIEAYRKVASEAGTVWREHGALHYVECVADDVPEGEHTDFYRAVKREPGETVVFAWIVYESREHRDAVLKAVMADPRMQHAPETMPFDGKRMMWGGFRTLVDL